MGLLKLFFAYIDAHLVGKEGVSVSSQNNSLFWYKETTYKSRWSVFYKVRRYIFNGFLDTLGSYRHTFAELMQLKYNA